MRHLALHSIPALPLPLPFSFSLLLPLLLPLPFPLLSHDWIPPPHTLEHVCSFFVQIAQMGLIMILPSWGLILPRTPSPAVTHPFLGFVHPQPLLALHPFPGLNLKVGNEWWAWHATLTAWCARAWNARSRGMCAPRSHLIICLCW